MKLLLFFFGCVHRNALTFVNGGTFRYLEEVGGSGDVMLSRHAFVITKVVDDHKRAETVILLSNGVTGTPIA